jgi:hypothetical protein
LTAPLKKLTGRIAPERIRMMTVPRLPGRVVERFKALGDPSGGIAVPDISRASYGEK